MAAATGESLRPQHEDEEKTCDDRLPQRRHADEQQPVLQGAQKDHPEDRSHQTDAPACDDGAAKNDGGYRFQRQRAADGHFHVTVRRDIEGGGEAAKGAARRKGQKLRSAHRDAGEARARFRVSDCKKMRSERRQAERDEDGEIHDRDHQNGNG